MRFSKTGQKDFTGIHRCAVSGKNLRFARLSLVARQLRLPFRNPKSQISNQKFLCRLL
jgi:hypothetical protein